MVEFSPTPTLAVCPSGQKIVTRSQVGFSCFQVSYRNAPALCFTICRPICFASRLGILTGWLQTLRDPEDMSDPRAIHDSRPASQFPGTRWSIVIQVQASDPGLVEEALEEICRRYWYPIYAFLRKKGRTPADAEDLTQGFFQRLLSDGTLERARQERGKLRSFLLADLKHFLVDQSRRVQAIKRGGGTTSIPLDQAAAEVRYAEHFTDSGTDPEMFFERAWVGDLLARVMNTLAAKYTQAGKGPLFEALRDSLIGGDAGVTYGDLAKKLNLSVGALRLQVMRMRRAFRDQLEREIAETVESPEQVAEEMRYLVGLLRR